MALFQLENISKTFENGSKALLPQSLNLNSFSKLGIVGETGSGKSTLLRIMAGLEDLSTGTALYKDEPIKGPSKNLIPGHPEIAYLSQRNKLPHSTTVGHAFKRDNYLNEQESTRIFKATQVLEFLEKETKHLSGGESQRVALAAVLLKEPEILLLDEPFSHQDQHHKAILQSVLKEISDNMQIPMIMVSHDPMEILSWADSILIMKGGRIIQQGKPEEIYKRPISEYVAGLFGHYSLITPKLFETSDKQFHTIEQKQFVRPEMFILKEKPFKGSKAGQIIGRTYYGSHDELTIESSNELIHVRAEAGKFKDAKSISLALK